MSSAQSQRTEQSGSTGQGAEGLVEGFKELKNSTQWILADRVKVGFVTHHPQGMVKVGDLYFLSSVDRDCSNPRKAATTGRQARVSGTSSSSIKPAISGRA